MLNFQMETQQNTHKCKNQDKLTFHYVKVAVYVAAVHYVPCQT